MAANWELHLCVCVRMCVCVPNSPISVLAIPHVRSLATQQSFATPKSNMISRRNLHQMTFLVRIESQKAVEAHGCKSWVTKLLIVPHAWAVEINPGPLLT